MIEHPELKMKQLLDDHKSGKITLADLNKECAYWLMETFETFGPRPYPSTPIKYTEFKNMPLEKQMRIKDEFYQREEIKTYLEAKQTIKNENEGHVLRLKEFIEYLPPEDTKSRERFTQKLYDFEVKDYS